MYYNDKLNFMVVLFCIFFILLLFRIFFMVGNQEDRIEELEDRLSKIERDAIKMTFKNDEKR